MPILLVGLGNPGQEHEGTRHNIGFEVADAIIEEYGFSGPKQKFKGEFYEGEIAGQKVYLLKPMTYMNLSGQSVAEAAKFYKVPLSSTIVIHDELDLEPLKVRVKIGGGNAGHNGLRSIDASLGSKDYQRLRIGIGHPGDKDKVSGYVLKKFPKAEEAKVEKLVDDIIRAIPLLIEGKSEDFMTKVALLTQPPKEKVKEESE